MSRHSKLSHALWTIPHVIKGNMGLSYETRYSIIGRLRVIVKDLHELGFKIPHLKSLKQKHIPALVEHWKQKQLAPATMKNRMSALRTACNRMGKYNVIKSNNYYDIPSRIYVSTHNKAIHDFDSSKINNPYVKASLLLQRAFGLRREESIKIIPSQADKIYLLQLKGSWTKGNVPRSIPISTQRQRAVLDYAKSLVPRGASLIPKDKNYRQQRDIYAKQACNAGVRKPHGLRYAYVQQRYKEITGWECPLNGGRPRMALNDKEKLIDRQARLLISNEIGHARYAITKIYLG